MNFENTTTRRFYHYVKFTIVLWNYKNDYES